MSSVLCAGCGHANEVGARFCAQCGSSLAPRCAACGAELPPDAHFCSACGVSVEADPVGVSDGTLKVVSVVFSDLVGSTALQEALDTESVRRVMGRFYEAMTAVVERHGGAIQKFIGDAVVVVFGTPVVREDDALRAVRCAAAMVDAVEVLNEELDGSFGVRLKVRTGVNTGELVVNDEGIFVGDTMNTAARFEQAAGAGEVLIGEATRRLVREQVELEELEPLALKGKSEPVRAWRVVSVTSGSATRLEAPLVGRASELDRLRAALADAVAARACRLVSVVGSPGLGKSRLAAEFARVVDGEATVVQGHCEQSGEGITFLPVAEMLRGLAGIDEADDSETVVAKLTAIAATAPDRDRVVVPAAGLLGAGTPAAPEETFWSVRRLLESAARSRPLVVVLDDVHWGQPMFLDLVEHLVEWVRDAPILLVALARPELRDVREALAAAGRRPAEVIELEPLDSGESRTLVGGLLGGVEPPPVLVERMLATTEGNPLFLGELLRMLVDEGTLTRSGDGWIAAGGADAVQVPPTIQALLTARIERLRADERAVVERAAVIGQQFYRGAVAQLVAPPVRSGLDGHLETLRRKDMVEPDGTYWIDEPVYRFHHVLLRDAAYHLLLKEARAELHERFADWLARKAGELVGEHEEVIAYHLEQAHEYRRQLGPLDERARAIGARAAALLASAGQRALQREDLAAAANLLARALERAVDESASWGLAEALLSAGDTAGAAEVVKALAGPRAVVMGTQLAMLTGSGADLEAVIAATGELAGAGDGAGAAKGHHVTAQVQAQLGRVADVESSLDKALLAARKAEDRRRITAVLAAAPRAALWGPSPVVRASGRCLDVVRILRMTPGNRHVEAVALRCQAVLEAMRGRADAARDILAAGRTTLEELGLTLELHELDVHAGLVELLAGEPAAASELLADARDGFAALGVSVSAAQAAALAGRALVEQGRFDEALAETEFAQEHAGGDLKTTITWLGVRAEALVWRGGLDEALELARRAVELAEPTDALADKADATMALARVLREAGRTDESRSAAEAARTLYAAKDHVVGAARAGQLLEAASAPAPTASGPLAPGATVPDPELARFFARYSERVEARDLEGLVSLYAPDYVLFDHRPVGWGERRGRAKAREQMESVFAASPDLRFCIDELLDCAPGVVAMRIAWRGSSTETGGTLEVPLGYVATIVEGRLARLELFEPDAETSVRACFADLRGRMLLGARPPELWWAEFVELLGQHDRSGLAHMWSPDMVLVDHRSVGWEEMHGLDAMLELADSAWSMAPDVRASIDEVIACDECTSAILLTYVGSAADGGGLLEIPVGYVSVYAGGVGIRGEQFGPDDREAMLTRFAELGGHRTATLGHRPPERLLAQHVRGFNAHDVAGVCALVSDGIVYADHRTVAPGGAEGREAYERVGRSLFEIAPDVRVEVNDVLACDERVIVVRTTYSGQGADEAIAAYERSNCEVWLLGADGLFARTDHYDDDDPQGALARYAELGGGQSLLGDQPSERWWAHVLCAYARGDVEALVDLYAEDWGYTDHRQLGWETMRGQSEVREFWRSALSVSSAQYGEIDEVLGCDERVIAVAVTWRGIAADTGGAFALPVGNVSVVEAGRNVSQEQYEPSDRDALLTRYAELGGRRGVLGDRPPERWYARRMEAWNRRDRAAVAELYDPNIEFVDHRKLGWEVNRGRDAVVELAVSAWELMSADQQLTVEEVLACDEHVFALRAAYRGTGEEGVEFEIGIGQVGLVLDGRITQAHQYDPDDRRAMIARYAQLGGGAGPLGDQPPERWLARWIERYASHDRNGLRELWARDCVFIDHRELGWEELRGREALLAVTESTWAVVPENRCEVDMVLACDEHVIAVTCTFKGTAADGGGPTEIAFGWVELIEDGVCTRIDQYGYDEREAMLSRFAELTGGRGAILGDRPPERFWAEHALRWAAGDIEGILAMAADEWVQHDHRPVALRNTTRTELRRWLEGALAGVRNPRHEVLEVLARDDEVIAFRFRYTGIARRGVEFEIEAGVVAVVRDGLAVSEDDYEPGDRRAMIARYAELGGGLRRLGSSVAERTLAEFCRAYARRDLDAMLELIAEDFRWVDHRELGWDTFGRAGFEPMMAPIWAMLTDVHVEVDEVLAVNDDALAVLIRLAGHDEHGGAFELPVGQVLRYRDGVGVSVDQYDPSDRETMLRRFVELTGGSPVRQTEPLPLRLDLEERRRYNAHDLESWLELFADEYVLVDHRAIGWGTLDRDALRERTMAAMTSAPDIAKENAEVLACDDRAIALVAAFVGGGRTAGPWRLEFGAVGLAAEGRWVRTELFDAGEREAMLARYAELTAEDPTAAPSLLGTRLAERYLSRLQQVLNARDWGLLAQIVGDGWSFVDHRTLAWEEAHGRDACVAIMRSMFEPSRRVRFDIDEIVAADNRLVGARVAVRGEGVKAGTHEVVAGAVYRFDDGLWAGVDFYDYDDRQAIVARYTELGGGLSALGDAPLEQLWAEFCHRFARRDIDHLLELVSEEYTLIDHRPIGWAPTHGRAGFRELQETTWATADVRIEVGEVLAVGEHSLALLVRWVGHGGAEMGGGEFSAEMGRVTEFRNGQVFHVDQYEPEDREAMLARFAEIESRPVADAGGC